MTLRSETINRLKATAISRRTALGLMAGAAGSKRNEKYWKPNRPFMDGIEFAIIPELTTGARSVVANQNDLIYQLPPCQRVIVERAPNLRVVTGPTLYVSNIFADVHQGRLLQCRPHTRSGGTRGGHQGFSIQ